MTFNFDEIAILNQTLDIDNKDAYLEKLVLLKENTKNEDLKNSIDSLCEKIEILPNREFLQVYKDRNSNKLFSFPVYFI